MAEVLIGRPGADHVLIKTNDTGIEGWIPATVEVSVGGWRGGLRAAFFTGELARFAGELKSLHESLIGIARLEPIERYLQLEMRGDGKGHIHVSGVAQNYLSGSVRLIFSFQPYLDQSDLPDIIVALRECDPMRTENLE
jgi:hypothetical protein